MTEEIDRFVLPDFENLTGPDRFEHLDATLAEVESRGVIAPLPRREDQVRSAEVHVSRVRTIRTRLHLLGYLERDSGSAKMGERMRAAILALQRDSGILTSDGWVGPKTWKVLQELVSFEQPTNLSRWMGAECRPLLERATRLRLYALGMLNKRAADANEIDEGLVKFCFVARIFRLSTNALQPEIDLPTLSALFDQDRIVTCLAHVLDDLPVDLPSGLNRKKARDLVRRFRVCCAKIELWLLGYDVKIDGKGTYEVRRGNRRQNPKRLKTYDTIRDFWRDQGHSTAQARRAAQEEVGSDFFAVLAALQQEESDHTAVEEPEALYRWALAVDEVERQQVWDQIKSLGSRLWDGVKRIWRWLKSKLKAAAGTIRNWAVNAARVVHQYALNAFVTVRRLLALVKKTLSVLVNRDFPPSNADTLVIRRSIDFDYVIFINGSCRRERWKGLLDRFARRAYLFNLGTGVLGLLLKIIVDTAARILTGGFALMLSLLRAYPRLKALHGRLAEDQAFLALA